MPVVGAYSDCLCTCVSTELLPRLGYHRAGLHLRILARGAYCEKYNLRGVWGHSPPGKFRFLDFFRLHLVGFGQNIQHGQYSRGFFMLLDLADVEALVQTCYY